MQKPKKERDLAGTAAFEVALQYIIVRQDRSYHFLQLVAALSSLIFAGELCLIFLFNILLPLFSIEGKGCFRCLEEYAYFPAVFFSAACLVLVRLCKQRYAIEPGEQCMQRLNSTIMGPCLGMHFDCATGKLRSDDVWNVNIDRLGHTDYASQA
ncbi:hypothetical protein LSM04_001774 [Trypanosoma melophagium]|uniref:uncharacterized protein n=1 Tax=Trypanosoma melophagium TaxID=715481 RepID=UPI003519F3DD|nr:hypothetical protein LSM04_001774 [Trypanosoma melophagium]